MLVVVVAAGCCCWSRCLLLSLVAQKRWFVRHHANDHNFPAVSPTPAGFVVFDYAKQYRKAVEDMVGWHAEGKVVFIEVRLARVNPGGMGGVGFVVLVVSYVVMVDRSSPFTALIPATQLCTKAQIKPDGIAPPGFVEFLYQG